jgi:hypothetical protein
VSSISNALSSNRCKGARNIGAKILVGQSPHPRLGDSAGPYRLADPLTGEPLRVAGVGIGLLELQIRGLEPR